MLASPFYLHTWKKFVDEGVLDSNRINEKFQSHGIDVNKQM